MGEAPSAGLGAVTRLPQAEIDTRHMRAALTLAERGIGRCAPNPTVGCVLVRPVEQGGDAPYGTIIARAATAPGGRPHAESQALALAGSAAEGATGYVTLEPCSHHGRTPPCVDALIDAGVGRVVVATMDPDDRVAGGGIAKLKAAGITVSVGVCEHEALQINAGFLTRVMTGRPLVTLKLAVSLDGGIAAKTGHSRWITGPRARDYAHLLRARHDAILVGKGTALADDPSLTCRLAGLEARNPLRVLLDTHLQVPSEARLIQSAKATPTWIYTGAHPEPLALAERTGAGVLVHNIGTRIEDVLAHLGAQGINRLLVEGGADVARGLLQADCVDRLILIRAPIVLGDDAKAGIGALGLERVDTAPRFVAQERFALGADTVEHYLRDV